MSKAEDIEALKLRQKTLDRELTEFTQLTNDMLGKMSDIKAELSRNQKRLAQIVPSKVEISDHALIRFLERDKGLDVESIKAQIREVVGMESIGNCRIGGFVIRNNVVVTYAPRTSQTEPGVGDNVQQVSA